jgi:hypothetical protein
VLQEVGYGWKDVRYTVDAERTIVDAADGKRRGRRCCLNGICMRALEKVFECACWLELAFWDLSVPFFVNGALGSALRVRWW